MRIKTWQLALMMAQFAIGAVSQAGTVHVVTSFTKEVTDRYKKAFEAKYPDIKLEILNKSGSAAVPFVREVAAGQRPDVFWSSDAVAFEIMAREKLLQPAPDAVNPSVPKTIAGFPINDPSGFYYGQALSGFGIMVNRRYLQANQLPAPREWADLTKGVYFGHVAISSPSRSGSTHLTVETILQGEGWDKGWSELLQIAGNCAAVTDRSFGVPDGVNSGQFGIGLVIDFLGLAGRYAGFPVDFVYPSVTSVVPASIALVAGGRNSSEAKKFISYTLSMQGQELLFDPKISRMPVLPYSVAGLRVPSDYPNIYEVARRSKVRFDSPLSEARYPLVASLFDQTITFRFKELQAATRAIHAAERKLQGRAHPQAQQLLLQARSLAYSVLVDEKKANERQYVTLFHKNKKEVAVATQLSALEEEWNSKALANYTRAEELAREALSLLK